MSVLALPLEADDVKAKESGGVAPIWIVAGELPVVA